MQVLSEPTTTSETLPASSPEPASVATQADSSVGKVDAGDAERREMRLGQQATKAAARLPSGRQLGTRLAIYFAVLIGTLLGAGYLALRHMEQMYASLQRAASSALVDVQLAQDGLQYSNENSRLTLEIFLVKNREASDALLARRAENSQQIALIIDALGPRCSSEAEKGLLNAVKESRNTYAASSQLALHLLRDKGKRDAAIEVMVEHTAPVLYQYHATWYEFLRYQLDEVRAATERERSQYAATHRTMLVIMALAGLLAGGIAFVGTHTVERAIALRTRMQNEVRMLNSQLEQKVAQRTRELTHTEDQLRTSLAELREHADRVETVNQFVESLQSCLTLDEAYQQTKQVMSRFFPSGTLLMLNPSRNLLDAAASWGTPSTKQGPFSPQSCWALRKGQSHVVRPGSFALLCGHTDISSTASQLCIPLVAQGDSLGVLSLVTPEGRHAEADALKDKKELAVSLTEQMSLAFANLMLRETLKYQSVRDPLTGLFNRRHMEEALERELLRATRTNKPVSVLMADIDHFKQFNDSFGHEAGNLLLRELGSLLSVQVRGGDIACRYGGEEFLLILADTGLQTARQRAEKLAEQVRSLHVRHHGETLRRVTLSIGVAEYPRHGANAALLVTAADEALYRAKAQGRDRVVLVGDRLPDPPAGAPA
jgi:diguanylate cyclase (GGDEF)-like protein